MSFVASNGPSTQATNITITNASFFPNLVLEEFRTAMKVDAVATPERALHALRAAVIEVNNRLSRWLTEQINQGFNSITEIPAKPSEIEDQNKFLYLRAVWSLAKANLIERYRDYDTTKAGQEKAEALNESADDYRRDAAWAINDLVGASRSTVELI